MKNLKGKVTVELTVEEYVKINELIDRDRETPMIEYELSNNKSMAVCPNCGRVINTNFSFCGWCGQHIDTETYAL